MITRSYAQTSRRGALTAGLLLSALVASAPASAQYLVKYNFAGPPDGATSIAGLVRVGTTFYGTTFYGGTYGYGTVFKLVGVTETVLYSFQGNANSTQDGANPRKGLTYVPSTGMLYGTTVSGGSGPASNCPDYGSCGTVFRVSVGGAETVIYNFQGGTDGSNPASSLTYANGLLYGTTVEGGSLTCSSTYSSCGTVFSVTTAGVETVLHSFGGTSANDGANPYAAPIMVNGKLYGTTSEGGASCTDLPAGCGTVYELSPGWTETGVYAFHGQSGNDGAAPDSPLLSFAGYLWGTTFWGGANKEGMVFRLKRSGSNWNQTNIWNFTGGNDGGHPQAGLTSIGKFLYGVTSSGGISGCQFYYSYNGCGTIFQILGTTFTPAVYSFNNGNSPPDGGNPFGELLKSGQNLFGMTYGGGTHNSGTIYKFHP